MHDVSLVCAESVPLEIGWRAVVDGFCDYVVPLGLSFEQFQRLIADEEIGPAASLVAIRGGDEPRGVVGDPGA